MGEVLSTNNAFCWAGKGEYLVDFSCQSKSYLRTSTTIEAANTFLERHQEQPWLQCILISAGIEAVSRSEQKGGIRRRFLLGRGSVQKHLLHWSHCIDMGNRILGFLLGCSFVRLKGLP